MIYLSVDCETSGLDPETCQILSFAAVIEDTEKPNIPISELPHVHYIFNHDFIYGEPYALNMNKDLIEIISKGEDTRLIYQENFWKLFRKFLTDNDVSFNKVKVAGKNFGTFDKKFLDRVPFGHPLNRVTFHHRILDVGTAMLDFSKDDWIPNLDQCLEKAGYKLKVTHDALEDARDVIRVLRENY